MQELLLLDDLVRRLWVARDSDDIKYHRIFELLMPQGLRGYTNTMIFYWVYHGIDLRSSLPIPEEYKSDTLLIICRTLSIKLCRFAISSGQPS